LEKVKKYLISKDPKLEIVFNIVDKERFQLHTVIKNPYIALMGAIIRHKISYKNAKALRSKLYSLYGNILIPTHIKNVDLSFLGSRPATLIIL
jgi:3-methyladenine DNA glycosylase/8-oxoguanine DNA glycosylase